MAAIPVRATKPGFYGGSRKHAGDQFLLVDRKRVNPKTKQVEVLTIEKTTAVKRDAKGNIVKRVTEPYPLTAENQFSEEWMERLPNSEVPDSELEELALRGDCLAPEPKALKAHNGEKTALSEL